MRARLTPAEGAELRRLYENLGAEVCRKAAAANQIGPLVGSALISELGPDRVPDDWRAEVAANEARVRRQLDTLVSVVSRLRRSSCPYAVVESAGVLFGSELPFSAFCSGDFDILVSEADFSVAKASMTAEGFEPADRRGRPTYRVEYKRRAEDGKDDWLELGCRPFDRAWVPLYYHDRCAEWLRRTVPSARADVSVLEPTDALAFVSMHTSLHSFVRAPGLRLHVDVDRLVSDNVIDWARYAAEIRSMGIGPRAFTSLAMAQSLLGTAIPEATLDALAPGDMRWAALETIVSRAGVIADGRPKLRGATTILLDALLDERGVVRWLTSVAAPPTDWMREHFDREGRGVPAWRLQLERYGRLATAWRPR